MNNFQREITAQNVDRLVSVIKAEREAREGLEKRLQEAETQIRILTSKLNETVANANAALAIARNANGSSTTG